MIDDFSNINIFLEICSEMSKEEGRKERLDYVLKFCQHILTFYENIDCLESFLFSDEVDDENANKIYHALALQLHPDKFMSDATNEEIQIISKTFIKITAIKEERCKRQQRKKDDEAIKKNTININENIGIFDENENDDRLIIAQLEKDLFTLLMTHGINLSDQTHEALVHLYGRILQYLIYWNAEYDLNWLSKNLGALEDHCDRIKDEIMKANATEAFENALKLNINVKDGSWIETMVSEAVTDDQQRKKSDDISNTINIVAGIGSVAFVALSASVTFPAIIVATGIAAGQFVFNYERTIARCEDRENHFKSVVEAIKRDVKQVVSAAKKEVDYHINNRQILNFFNGLKRQNDVYLDYQREELKHKTERTEIEEEILNDLNEWHKELSQKSSFFSEEEVKALLAFDFDPDSVASSEEADMLRELLATLNSEDSIRLTLPEKPLLTYYPISNDNNDQNSNEIITDKNSENAEFFKKYHKAKSMVNYKDIELLINTEASIFHSKNSREEELKEKDRSSGYTYSNN